MVEFPFFYGFTVLSKIMYRAIDLRFKNDDLIWQQKQLILLKKLVVQKADEENLNYYM